MERLKIDGVSFSYGSKEVISDMSLGFSQGITSILGLNGSGKSTLIKLMVGLLKAKSGMIYIDGKNINELAYSESAKLIAYVPQLGTSNVDIKVIDYLEYSYASTIKFLETPSKAHRQKAIKQLEMFGIAHLSNCNLGSLSGGERQMVAICSAVLQDTPIIVLDEPTSALDMKNQNLVLNELKKLKDKTIILSTHNPNHCLHLGGNVCLIAEGCVANYGNVNDIIIPEVLSAVYGNNIVYSKDLIGVNEVAFKR